MKNCNFQSDLGNFSQNVVHQLEHSMYFFLSRFINLSKIAIHLKRRIYFSYLYLLSLIFPFDNY